MEEEDYLYPQKDLKFIFAVDKQGINSFIMFCSDERHYEYFESSFELNISEWFKSTKKTYLPKEMGIYKITADFYPLDYRLIEKGEREYTIKKIKKVNIKW